MFNHAYACLLNRDPAVHALQRDPWSFPIQAGFKPVTGSHARTLLFGAASSPEYQSVVILHALTVLHAVPEFEQIIMSRDPRITYDTRNMPAVVAREVREGPIGDTTFSISGDLEELPHCIRYSWSLSVSGSALVVNGPSMRTSYPVSTDLLSIGCGLHVRLAGIPVTGSKTTFSWVQPSLQPGQDIQRLTVDYGAQLVAGADERDRSWLSDAFHSKGSIVHKQAAALFGLISGEGAFYGQ